MTWLLIDGNNWFAQCDFASPEYGINNFCKRLDTVLQQVDHSRAVVCWDGGKSWRCELSEQYKAHREAKPAAYAGRMAQTRAAVDANPRVESMCVETYEADDLIATLTAIAAGEGERVIVFSADKDLHQLLSAGTVTQVRNVKRRSSIEMTFDTITADGLFKQYGVHPWQWVDYRLIVGDKSDGISGCDSLGPKAATSILQACHSLDNFYISPWKCPITQRQATLLSNYRDQVPVKRKLLTLVDAVPLPAKFFEAVAS